MEKLSYILSLIATVLGIIEPFNKKMTGVLIFSLVGNFIVGTSYFLVGAISGGVICSVACIQLIINYFYNAKGKKVPNWLRGIYIISFVAVNLLTFAHWYDALALTASIMFVLSVSQSNTLFYRIFFMSNSLLWIVYDIVAKAYGNLATHIILFSATMISTFIRNRKAKQ